MRIINTAAQTALASKTAVMVILVEMDLSSPLNLNISPLTLTIGGTTYYGTKGLGRIGSIADTPAEVKGLAFELSGAPTANLSLALSEQVRGKAVRILVAVLDATTYAVLDVHRRWRGKLESMIVRDHQGQTVISVGAEHSGIDLTRTASSVYNDAEQQRLHSGDLFFQYVTDQVDQQIIWPAAAFFHK